LSAEEQDLGVLLSSVTQLHDISLALNDKVHQQHAAIDRVDEKALRVNDQTLAVTLKATQLAQRTQGTSREEFAGYFQFVDDATNALLSVAADGTLTLAERADRSTVFKCWVRSGTLYALQNDKSLRYVSSTVWGPVRAVAHSFGRREECHLASLDEGRSTGFFFHNTNWGAGGWLKQPAPDSCVLDSVTNGVSDRHGMARFYPVCLGTVDGTPYSELGTRTKS